MHITKHDDAEDKAGGLEEGLPRVVTSDGVVKTRWERSWPTIACGAGLFSDGYVQSVSPTSPMIFCNDVH